MSQPKLEAGKVAAKTKPLALVLVFLLAALGSYLVSGRGTPAAGSLHRVRLADVRFLGSAPIYVALEKGLFRQEGIDLSHSYHWVGKEALKAVIQGTADICAVADYPVAMEAMKGTKIVVIATIACQSRTHSIVALKQYDIHSPKDLAGKKIGVSLGTNGHFILDTYLLYHNVPERSIRLIDLTADGMGEAIRKGEIQAAIIWGPSLARLITELGDKAVVFDGDEQHIYTQTWNLVATEEYVRKNPEDVRRVLRALSTAGAFIKEHGDESLAISRKYSEMEPAAARETWKRLKLALSLNALLVENLENEARWALKKGVVPEARHIPNFLNYISFNGLESVAPGAVTIVH